jgi:hypothetical protein
VVAPPRCDTNQVGQTGVLLNFHKAPNPARWQVFDHTPEVGGATVAGAPAVLRYNDDVNVFASA